MTYVKLILFIVAILISVLGGKKLKINAGLIAIGFAFIFGVTITGLGVNGVVNLFSARLFVNMFLVTFFFGYATANGTMLSITKYLFKNFKGAPWLLPLLFFAIPFLMAFAGASTDSIILFLTPIAFAFIIEAKLPPVLASILLWATCAGSWAPWLTNYATFSSWFGESIGMEAAEAGFTKLFVVTCVINISFMLISYIVLGGWKVKTSMEILGDEKIEITKEQKKTMYIILAVIAVLIIPTLIQLILPNPVTGWMKANLTIQVLSALGIIAMHLTKAADTNDVIKNQIPWGLIIMVCGMAMLMGEAGNLGVTETISALLEVWIFASFGDYSFHCSSMRIFKPVCIRWRYYTADYCTGTGTCFLWGIRRSNYSCITDGYDCNQLFLHILWEAQSALPAVLKSIQAKSETSS